MTLEKLEILFKNDICGGHCDCGSCIDCEAYDVLQAIKTANRSFVPTLYSKFVKHVNLMSDKDIRRSIGLAIEHSSDEASYLNE